MQKEIIVCWQRGGLFTPKLPRLGQWGVSAYENFWSYAWKSNESQLKVCIVCKCSFLSFKIAHDRLELEIVFLMTILLFKLQAQNYELVRNFVAFFYHNMFTNTLF